MDMGMGTPNSPMAVSSSQQTTLLRLPWGMADTLRYRP
jgi:hypothetical protein